MSTHRLSMIRNVCPQIVYHSKRLHTDLLSYEMSTQRSSVLRNVYSQINCPTKCPPPQNVYNTKVLSQIVYPSKCLLTDSLSYKMSTHRTSILLHKCLRVDSLSYKKSTHRPYILKQRHFVSTHRGVKGVGNHFFSQIEPN